MKQTEQLLAQFCTIIYIISEFNLDEKKNFVDSILGTNLHT